MTWYGLAGEHLKKIQQTREEMWFPFVRAPLSLLWRDPQAWGRFEARRAIALLRMRRALWWWYPTLKRAFANLQARQPKPKRKRVRVAQPVKRRKAK